MFRLMFLASILLLSIPGWSYAQITPEAESIVSSAIKAAGGEARLSNLKAAEWKTKGVGYFTGKPMPSQTTLIGQLPDRFRRDSESTVDGVKQVKSLIINGNQGWSKEGTILKTLSEQEIMSERDTFHHKRVALTLAPLKEKDIAVEYLGEDKVEGKSVSVLNVKKKGFHDLKLFIDKSTHLVIKSEGLAVDSRSGKETRLEHYYSLHKSFDGIQYPVKTVTLRDGKLMLEIETLEFKPTSQIDPKQFLP